MKTILVIMIATITLGVSAQNDRPEHSKQKKHDREMMKDLSPEELSELKTKKMTLHLDLNETQQSQIKALILEEVTLKQKRRSEREALINSEGGSKPSKEERLQMMNEELDRKIELKENMRSILNDEQFEKWEQMQMKRTKKKRKHDRRE